MRSRTLSSIAATAVMALGISLLVTGPGSAEPNKTLAQAQEELEALEIRAGTASEKFNEAEVLLAAATRRVEQARTKAGDTAPAGQAASKRPTATKAIARPGHVIFRGIRSGTRISTIKSKMASPSVVLPEPDSPTTPSVVPDLTEMVTSSTART